MYESTGEPDAVEITNIPGHYINDERKEQLLFDRLQNSLVAGVRLANVEFIKEFNLPFYFGSAVQVNLHDIVKMNGLYSEIHQARARNPLGLGAISNISDVAVMKGGK